MLSIQSKNTRHTQKYKHVNCTEETYQLIEKCKSTQMLKLEDKAITTIIMIVFHMFHELSHDLEKIKRL